MKITEIILHHFGGLKANPYASTINVTAEQVSRYHKSKWNFPSLYIKNKNGSYAGYTFIYLPSTRKFVQTRAIGESGAHTIGLNNSSVGLAIAGNYSKTSIGSPRGSVDELTEQTVQDVTEFLYDLIHGNKRGLLIAPHTQLKLSTGRVHPHRFYQKSTECYGTAIPDNFFRDMLIKHELQEKLKLYQKLLKLLYTILDLQKKKNALGVVGRECNGFIDLTVK